MPKGASSKLTHIYTMVHYVNGDKEFRVLTAEQLEARRKRSRASNDGPWVTDYEAMCMKTGIRDSCKWTPNASAETQTLHKAIALDEHAETDVPQDLGIIADPETETPTEPTPAEPTKVPAPTTAKTERSLSERWQDLQAVCKNVNIDIKRLMEELAIKEVTNANIEQIEAAIHEKMGQMAERSRNARS